jgi:hypothetical protein
LTGTVRRLAGTVSASFACSALGIAALPVSAHAALVSLNACDNSALSQPFTPWADSDYYKLAPGGDFEGSLGGWSLSGGAGQGAGSESYGVTGSVGSSSLSLPAGSNAVSPATCVNAAYPTFRFFVRSDTPGTLVTESVIYQTAVGPVTIPVGTVPATDSWQPTPPMLTASAIPGALNGGTANVQLQFTASGGSAQVDDVEVDPYRHG